MKVQPYKELRQYIKAFKDGHITFLTITSIGGLGKTSLVIEELPEVLYFNGKMTAFAMLKACEEHPNALIALDDCDNFFDNKDAVPALKQVTDTKPDRRVTYFTKNEHIDFISNNRFIILANTKKKRNPDIDALYSRGFQIEFTPSNKEVYEAMLEWATDKEILEYLKDVPTGINLNFRMYVLAQQLKNAGLDWINLLKEQFKIPLDLHIAKEIENLPRSKRDSEWTKRTGKSTRTLYRLLKQN